MNFQPLGGQLIFLVSQPRAGSTLLQRILAAHPQVHTLPEPWIMLLPAYGLRGRGLEAEFDQRVAGQAVREFVHRLPGKDEAYVEALRRQAGCLYEQALAGTGKTYFVDKTPRYYLILPELRRIFPEARFVFLLRNPLAVLASILDTWVINCNWQRLSTHRLDLLAAPGLLADGIDSPGGGAQVVKYEALAQEPERTVEDLCCGLGLDYHVGMLRGGPQVADGRFGDKASLRQQERPSADRLERWIERLARPDFRYFAESLPGGAGAGLAGASGLFVRRVAGRAAFMSRAQAGPDGAVECLGEAARVSHLAGARLHAAGHRAEGSAGLSAYSGMACTS